MKNKDDFPPKWFKILAIACIIAAAVIVYFTWGT